MSELLRFIREIQLRRIGYWVAARQETEFDHLFWHMLHGNVLTSTGLARIRRALTGSDEPVFTAIFEDTLRHRRSFRDPAVWALFWSLARASHEMIAAGLNSTHEPSLNGIFLKSVETNIARFAPQGRALGRGRFREVMAVALTDLNAWGNESRTGADFGLIIEMERGGISTYLATLVQAKRATSRKVDIRRGAGTSTQLDLLRNSGMGLYLFYICHSEPAKLPPTAKSAVLVSQETAGGSKRVDSVSLAEDFAARIACGVGATLRHPDGADKVLPELRKAATIDEALRLVFDPAIPGIRVNDVLVARIGEAAHPLADTLTFERRWRLAVEARRMTVQAIRTDPDEQEPPITIG